MSYRAWLFIAAIGLTEHAIAQEQPSAPIEGQPIAEQGEEEGGPHGDDAPGAESQTPPDLTPAIQGVEAAIRDLVAEQRAPASEDEEDRARRDLEAQEDMAFWAQAMFWVTGASVLVTFVGVLLVKWTLTETRKAANHADSAARAGWETVKQAELATAAAVKTAEIAREMGQAQVRAYLHIDSVECAPTRDGERVYWHLSASIRNSGQSPARDVKAHLVLRENQKSGFGASYYDIGSGESVVQEIGGFTRTGDLFYSPGSATKLAFQVTIAVRFRDIFQKRHERTTIYGDFFASFELKEGERIKMRSTDIGSYRRNIGYYEPEE